MSLAPQIRQLAPSPTMQISTRAKQLLAQGLDVLDLSVGEPDLATPPPITEAAKKAIDDGWTHYPPVGGLPELRRGVADDLQRRLSITTTADQIVISTGAKQSLFNAIRALIGPGDEVLLPAPYWVTYPAQVALAGGVCRFVPTRAEDGFQLDPKEVEAHITPKTKMLLLNSPNNPTGTVYPAETMSTLVDLAIKHDFWILSDEIYERLTYDELRTISPHQLRPDAADRLLLVNGFSKSYAMTGWRLGYLVAPKHVADAAIAIQGAVTSGASTISQRAALAALNMSEIYHSNTQQLFEQRLHDFYEAWRTVPEIYCLKPQGAFYLFPGFQAYLGRQTSTGQVLTNDTQLAGYLLEEARVASVPGSAFGMPGHLRFSYAHDIPKLKQAVVRIHQALVALEEVS